MIAQCKVNSEIKKKKKHDPGIHTIGESGAFTLLSIKIKQKYRNELKTWAFKLKEQYRVAAKFAE